MCDFGLRRPAQLLLACLGRGMTLSPQEAACLGRNVPWMAPEILRAPHSVTEKVRLVALTATSRERGGYMEVWVLAYMILGRYVQWGAVPLLLGFVLNC